LTIRLPISHPDIEIRNFQSVRSPGFRLYLESTGIYFVMCHDGASSTTATVKYKGQECNGLERSKDKDNHHEKVVLRGIIFWFISRGFDVSLVNEVEWRDSKVALPFSNDYESHFADQSV